MNRLEFPNNGRVTAVIPAYNRADSVGDAIRSALGQSAADRCDVVVVDDGGTDETPAILRTFGDRIRTIRQENAGVSAARNAAIRACPNEFTAFLDSDDQWEPRTVELQLDAMNRYPEAVLVTGRSRYRDASGVTGSPPMPEVPLDRPFDLAPYLFERCIIQTPAVMVRSVVFERSGLFRPELRNCGDHELWVRVACEGPCVYLPQTLLTYCRADRDRLTGSVTRAFTAEIRARRYMHRLLHLRPDCRPYWRRGLAEALRILRDHAYRTRCYPAAARCGFHSLMILPHSRPRWEWRKTGAALLHSIFR